MDKLIRKYKSRLKMQVIFIIILLVAACTPSYILINAKIRNYFNPEQLTYANAELHVLTNENQNGFQEVLSYFDTDYIHNRTFLLDEHRIFGPFYEDGDKKYFIIQLERDFFVVAESRGSTLSYTTGGLGLLGGKADYYRAMNYLNKIELIDDRAVNYKSYISPYIYKEGYVGNLSETVFFILGLSMLAYICVVCIYLYRLIRYSPLRRFLNRVEDLTRRDKEIMDYEIEGGKHKKGMLFGRNHLYFRIGSRSNILQFIKYDHIIWYYPDRSITGLSRIVIYDKYHVHYLIHDSETAIRSAKYLEELQKRAPYAICGYDKKLAKSAKHNFYELIRITQQNRQNAIMRQQLNRVQQNAQIREPMKQPTSTYIRDITNNQNMNR